MTVTLSKTYAFSKVSVKQRLNVKGKKGIDELTLSGPEVRFQHLLIDHKRNFPLGTEIIK